MHRPLTLSDLHEAEAWARSVHASAPPPLLRDWHHQERGGPDVPLLPAVDQEHPADGIRRAGDHVVPGAGE